MRSHLILLTLVLILSACVRDVQKIPVATGGSKADASVNMSYDVAAFENPIVNWQAAQKTAQRRCAAWGYSTAEGFEGQTQVCNARNGYGTCVRATITRTYQCLN